MNKIFKVKPLDDKKSIIIIHPKTADSLGISKRKIIIIRFGSLRQFADIILNADMAENEIHLSSRLIASLHLPCFADYEIRVSQNEMEIGPFIGMLMSKEDKNLTTHFLEKIKIYVSDYALLHGAVVIFALDKVDAAGRLIEGYCYNPVSQKFEKGTYPFPSAIYRTIGLNEDQKNLFLSAIGDRFFNNHYFNKWKMYNWYSNDPDLSRNLPFTAMYQTAQEVLNLLEKYNKVYIKPVFGLGGHGITQVHLSKGKYVFKYRDNGENQSETIKNKEKALEYIDSKFNNGKYLIQQPIELIQIGGRIVDFRCIMQKSQAGKWICKAIIGRFGGRGSVVSNISSGGTAVNIENIEKSSIPLPENMSLRLSDDIKTFAFKVCNALDEYGLNCGSLGLDIGVDTSGKLWLIEINNRDPDPTIALDANDRELYKNIKTGILFYAKLLSGF